MHIRSFFFPPRRRICGWFLYDDIFLQQLIIALNELETLNPAVKQKVKELERKPMCQVIGWNYNDRANENQSLSSSVQWPTINTNSSTNNQVVKVHLCFSLYSSWNKTS